MDRYEEARERAKKLQEKSNGMILKKWLWNIFPELKENEDERVKSCISMILTDANETRFNDFHTTLADCLAWLERQKPIQNINKEDEEVRQYIVRIMEQRDINVPMVQKALAWLEKQSKTDKIVEKAKIEKQRVLVTESDGSANIDWDTRSLKDAITLLKHGLNYLQEIEVKKQIMPNSRFGGCSECIPTRFDKEKQGKKESNDKNEPKFKVGVWCRRRDGGVKRPIKITKVLPLSYEAVNDIGYHHSIEKDCLENNYDLWTIDDARDGDVLATSAGAFIYNGKRGGGSCPGSYCGINTLGNFQTGAETHWTGKTVNPATNEQRVLLFQKMQEAGYEWLKETKELKKIEQKSAEWSEEDDIMVRDILGWLPAKSRPEFNQRRVDWLKSLKNRVQSKQEFSEEDDIIISKINSVLNAQECWDGATGIKMNPYKDALDWLKSLKQRCTWKPSDEQITVLELASKYERVFTHKQIDILIDLKEQLKKLTVKLWKQKI